MFERRRLCVVLFFAVLVAPWANAGRTEAQTAASSNNSSSIKGYLGRWDLTINAPKQERPSWIELSERRGQVEGLMVGFWGHATPTGTVHIKDGEMEFTAPTDEGFDEGTVFKGKLASGLLAGTATSPKGVSWQWTGRRAPALERSGEPHWGKSVRLFDGKDLSGWKFADPSHAGVWSVKDSELVKNGPGSELISVSKFRDFKLHVEFNCGPTANSGVYLRGRYEVQIETDSSSEPPDQRMGAVYGFLTPEPAPARTPDVWHTCDITLVGRTLTLVNDGQTVIDHKEIPGITGGALDSHEGLPGPIYLQGSEAGRVFFRNIVIRPAE
jgi:3-keto-disaccharide hydrolase